MKETGRVTAVRGDRAEVELAEHGECGHCPAHGICSPAGGKTRRVLAVNHTEAVTGDTVMVALPDSTGLRSNLLVFGVPTLLMLAGVLIGSLLLKRDLWAGLLAGVGLAVGVMVVKMVDIAATRSGRTLPVVVERLKQEDRTGDECDKETDGVAGGGARGA